MSAFSLWVCPAQCLVLDQQLPCPEAPSRNSPTLQEDRPPENLIGQGDPRRQIRSFRVGRHLLLFSPPKQFPPRTVFLPQELPRQQVARRSARLL